MIEQVVIVYFSATGTTRAVVRTVGGSMAAVLKLPLQEIDFTLPPARNEEYHFSSSDFVLFACPVYAGRIPNVLLPFIQNRLHAHHTAVAAVAVYGNRHYDDALRELAQELVADGFTLVGAGAFVGEHAFSTTLAAGRPDVADLAQAAEFGGLLAQKVLSKNAAEEPFALPGGGGVGPYYTPRDKQGNRINILKVRPRVSAACTRCGRCVLLCPMGSIDIQDVTQYAGICIKCGACVKGCPENARHYDDAGYLYHKEDLEETYKKRKEPVFWV